MSSLLPLERFPDNTVASSTCGEDRRMVESHKVVDPHGACGVYTGVILRSTGKPHGRGRMVYDEKGRTYDGNWCRGQQHGYGLATFANGDTYEGDHQFDQRHGRGTYRWSDGMKYVGEFREFIRHGQGTLTWPNGDKYEGEFQHGQRQGKGRCTFSDGGYYDGSWVNGRHEGYGGTSSVC